VNTNLGAFASVSWIKDPAGSFSRPGSATVQTLTGSKRWKTKTKSKHDITAIQKFPAR
jgi:hypothetical protein